MKNKIHSLYCIMFVLLAHGLAFGQVKRFDVPVVFKDTVGGIMVFDSASHNFGRQKLNAVLPLQKGLNILAKIMTSLQNPGPATLI